MTKKLVDSDVYPYFRRQFWVQGIPSSSFGSRWGIGSGPLPGSTSSVELREVREGFGDLDLQRLGDSAQVRRERIQSLVKSPVSYLGIHPPVRCPCNSSISISSDPGPLPLVIPGRTKTSVLIRIRNYDLRRSIVGLLSGGLVSILPGCVSCRTECSDHQKETLITL